MRRKNVHNANKHKSHYPKASLDLSLPLIDLSVLYTQEGLGPIAFQRGINFQSWRNLKRKDGLVDRLS